MCGIIGYVGFQDPKGILLDGLKRLEYRGYDSAGIAILDGNSEIEVFRSEGRLHCLEEKLGTRKFAGTLGLGHTRWATHGAPTEMNAHPHRVGSITLVHNGIIENYVEHKERILSLGRRCASDTDSEIVAHLFDMEIASGKTLAEAIPAVLPTLKGSYAFVILNDKEPNVIAGVRNGPPLLVGVGEKENFIASDVQAILHRTKRIVYLNDQEYVLCRRDGITIRDEQGRAITPAVKEISWTADQMEKNGYRHFMLKEIHEQARALTNTIENNIDHGRGVISLLELRNAAPRLRKVRRISLVACGTARHAGLIGKFYLEKYAGIQVEVDYGSEFRYRNPILDEETLLICVSQSGETADTLAGLREGKRRGIPTLAICNVRDSTIARESDMVVYTNAGPEIGVASTKAFTTQLAVLYMLAVEMGFLNGTLSQEAAQELTTDLLKLPILVDSTLALEKEIEEIAAQHQTNGFFFYMGRGINYPIALEGALKLKEISYLHAEGYPAGELKHGPIALIDRNAAVLVLAPQDEVFEKVMSNLHEVKSRGGQIWGIGNAPSIQLTKECRFFSSVPKGTWGLNPILLSIPMQLFAYYVALQRGTDVDKPRNLAKSVTVE